MIQQKVNEFFASHPDATQVHEALGRLFLDKDQASKFLSGVHGKVVTTYTRDGVVHAKKSDAIAAAIREQETVVDSHETAYHQVATVDKEQAMSQWKKEQFKLQQLHHQLKAQLRDEEKDAALAATATTEQLGEEFNITLGAEEETQLQQSQAEETPVVEETATVVEETPVTEEAAPALEETPVVKETAPVVEEAPVVEASKPKGGKKK